MTGPEDGRTSMYDELLAFYRSMGQDGKDLESMAEFLEKRYASREYFIQLGKSCLLFMNPGGARDEPGFDKESLDTFLETLTPDAYALTAKPHFFQKATTLYTTMLLTGQDQSVVLMGESGSGKTESAKYLLTQLLHMQQRVGSHTDGKQALKLKNRILAAQHVLQLFGHCKTLSGPNASRHTVLTEVQFDRAGVLQGVQFSSYGFERRRVTMSEKHERNFHVFYAMLAGGTPSERSEWQLPSDSPSRYAYLKGGSQRSDFDNVRLFQDLRASFSILGLTTSYQHKLFEILAALLLLGNLEFVDAARGVQDACTIRNIDVLESVAVLLGVDATVLASALTYETQFRQRERCTVFLTAVQAAERRDRLVQQLYFLLFSWLLAWLNDKLRCKRVGPITIASNMLLINIVDVAGYEVFPRNGFTQFMANYTNEKAHGVLLRHLAQMRRDYGAEGVPMASTLDERMHRSCLSLYEDAANGIIQLLDAATPEADDAALLSLLRRTISSATHEAFLDVGGNVIAVKHYFGVTQYSIEQFVALNGASLDGDFASLIRGGYDGAPQSRNTFLRNLLGGTPKAHTFQKHQPPLEDGCFPKNSLNFCMKEGEEDENVFVAENARQPMRTTRQLDRQATLHARRSQHTSLTLMRQANQRSKAAAVVKNAGESLGSLGATVASELLAVLTELFDTLMTTSSLSFILCLRVLKQTERRGAGDTLTSLHQQTHKGTMNNGGTGGNSHSHTLRSRMGTFRGGTNVSFDKIRLLYQLRAHCIYEWLQMLNSVSFPIHITYRDCIAAVHQHALLKYGELLDDKNKGPLIGKKCQVSDESGQEGTILHEMGSDNGSFQHTYSEGLESVSMLPSLDALNDTHALRERMRDYLWLREGLGTFVSTSHFHFGVQFILMTPFAASILEGIFRYIALLPRQPSFLTIWHSTLSKLIKSEASKHDVPEQVMSSAQIVESSPPLPPNLEAPSPIKSIPREDWLPTQDSLRCVEILSDRKGHQMYRQSNEMEEKIAEVYSEEKDAKGKRSLFFREGHLREEQEDKADQDMKDVQRDGTDMYEQSGTLRSMMTGNSGPLLEGSGKFDMADTDATMISISGQRRIWLWCVRACTGCLPDGLLGWGGLTTPEMQLAWREKCTLCFIILLLSAFLLFYIMGLSYILCPPQRIINASDLARKPYDQPNVIIRGRVYDLTQFLPSHVGGSATPDSILKLGGLDVTPLFPMARRCKLAKRPSDTNGENDDFDAAVDEEVDEENRNEFDSGNDGVKSGAAKMAAKLHKKKAPKFERQNDPEYDDEVLTEAALEDIDGAKRFNKTGKGGASREAGGEKVLRDPGCVVAGFSFCHAEAYMYATLAQYLVGDYGMTRAEVARCNGIHNALIIISGRIYNVTSLLYYDGTLTSAGQAALLSAPWGTDKTAAAASNLAEDLSCLADYEVGVVDERDGIRCVIADLVLLGSTALVVAVMAFKFLAALQLGAPRDPEHLDKFVILQVPCYTEGETSLRKTLSSLAHLAYADARKLLFITADGMVVGSGNDRPTPRIVLDILGVDAEATPDPAPLAFLSIGAGSRRHNRGKVYAGYYEVGGHRVPYVVVVKVGAIHERARPGNRGKRDSQMILLRFLANVHTDAPMTPLELAIYHAIRDVLRVDPAAYEYLLMVDADTEVSSDAATRMVSCMLHDGRIMGICGETRIANESDSWVTMIQVYEYYISHHLAKAFESLFGSVTCLPGCFCMYRLKSGTAVNTSLQSSYTSSSPSYTASSAYTSSNTQKARPLLIDARVLDAYAERDIATLHQRNLLSLGEDRFLTTLMLKHFPNLKIAFTPDAMCRTTVPDRWSILLSQRRRWINSTIHNLWELLLLPQLCGCACFSMRLVVALDLFATLVMPATVAYLFFLIYQAVLFQMVPVISLCMLAAVYGMQVAIFLLKRQWQYIGWMLIYILALPLYGLFIPLYAFWHFDDFSWGNTRRVLSDPKLNQKEKEKEKVKVKEKGMAKETDKLRDKDGSGKEGTDPTFGTLAGRTEKEVTDMDGSPVIPLIKWSDYLALSASARLAEGADQQISQNASSQLVEQHHWDKTTLTLMARKKHPSANHAAIQFVHENARLQASSDDTSGESSRMAKNGPSMEKMLPKERTPLESTTVALVPLSCSSSIMTRDTISKDLVARDFTGGNTRTTDLYSRSADSLAPHMLSRDVHPNASRLQTLIQARSNTKMQSDPQQLSQIHQANNMASYAPTLVGVTSRPRSPSIIPTTPVYFPTDDELISAIKSILSTSDLSKITKKSIRDALTAHFGPTINLIPKRDFINNIIDLILAKHL